MRQSQKLYNVEDARRLARRRMPRMMFDFVAGAAGSETGKKLNQSSLKTIKLQPRALINIENGSLAANILGQPMGLPFGFAPMGMCELSWPGADRFMAAEAVRRNIPLCVSTASSTTLEDMQRLSGGRAWFQLYTGTNSAATEELIARAEAAGYSVLIMTVDTPKLSRRIRDQRNGFQVPFRFGPKQILDFALHPRWSIATLLNGIPKPMNYETSRTEKTFKRGDSRGATDWNFLDALRKRWGGKLVIKGVMSPEDAVRMRDAGVDSVYVSNHGGRQLDQVDGAIDILAEVAPIVGDKAEIAIDGGFLRGTDVLKAVALGADAVGIGKLQVWALALGGPAGLARAMDIMADEISAAMGLMGITMIEEINCDYVKKSYPVGSGSMADVFPQLDADGCPLE